MEQEKIARINFLAKKAKTEEGLTHEEAQEQHALRQEYLDEIRFSLISTLDNTYIQDEHGNKRKLERKKPDKPVS